MSADKAKKPAKKKTPAKAKKKAKSGKNDTPTRKEKVAATTENNKEKLLKALSLSGGNVTKACKKAGLDRATHYRYMEDPEYAERVHEVYEENVDEAEDVVLKLMRTSKMDKVRLDAAKEILKARGKDRGYGTERREQKLEGEIGVGGVQLNLYLPDNGKAAEQSD